MHISQQNHVDHVWLAILEVKTFSSLTLLRYVLKMLAPYQVALFKRY